MRNVLIKKDKNNLNRLELDRFSKVILTDTEIDTVNEDINLSEMKLYISNLNSDTKEKVKGQDGNEGEELGDNDAEYTENNKNNKNYSSSHNNPNNVKKGHHTNIARGGHKSRGSRIKDERIDYDKHKSEYYTYYNNQENYN